MTRTSRSRLKDERIGTVGLIPLSEAGRWSRLPETLMFAFHVARSIQITLSFSFSNELLRELEMLLA